MNQCDWCGKNLAKPRANETGYKFCSHECKKKGLDVEQKNIGAKMNEIAYKTTHIQHELSVLVQERKKLNTRMTQIGWTLRDPTKKSLIREVVEN